MLPLANRSLDHENQVHRIQYSYQEFHSNNLVWIARVNGEANVRACKPVLAPHAVHPLTTESIPLQFIHPGMELLTYLLSLFDLWNPTSFPALSCSHESIMLRNEQTSQTYALGTSQWGSTVRGDIHREFPSESCDQCGFLGT